MKTLIEALEQRQLEMLGDGRSTVRAQIASETGHCIAVIQDACTPRPPKPEWFGTPFDAEGKATGKWDAWWLDGVGVLRHCRMDELNPSRIQGVDEAKELASCRLSGRFAVISCVPIAREDFPAPVGWQVVEKP